LPGLFSAAAQSCLEVRHGDDRALAHAPCLRQNAEPAHHVGDVVGDADPADLAVAELLDAGALKADPPTGR